MAMERQLDGWRDATGSLNPDAVRPADDPADVAAWNGNSLELLIQAAEFIGGRSSIAPPGMLSRRLDISYQHAREVLDLLHAEGSSGRPGPGGGPVRCSGQHGRGCRSCVPGCSRTLGLSLPGSLSKPILSRMAVNRRAVRRPTSEPSPAVTRRRPAH